MVLIIKRKLISIAEFLHLKIFGHEMSDEMRKFLDHLSWSFFGGFIAAGIMFAVNVSAGRLFGPVEFGKYNYLISLAAAFVFFFLLGNNQSSIRHISDKNYRKRKGKFLSAIFSLTLAQSAVFLLVIIFSKKIIAKEFNLEVDIIYFIFFLAFVFSFKELFDSFIRSFELFKKQSIAKIFDAVIVFAVFFISYILFKGKISHIHYAAAMAVGAIFSISYFFYFIRKHLSRFSKDEIRDVFSYNKFLILGGIAGFIMSLEKVFIGKYIGLESLGIYSAYYASSQMIVSNIGILFMNIFWPAIVKNKDNIKSIVDKLDKIFLKYFLVWVMINSMSITFFVLLYGKQYPTNFLLILLFSFSSIANIAFFVFANILSINKIARLTAINIIIYIVLVSSIVIFKNIPIYLIIQIVIYLFGIVYVRKIILRDATKKYEITPRLR